MTHLRSTVMVWELAGCPAPPGADRYSELAAPCVMCGRETEVTAPAAVALGSNFADPYGLYRRADSTRVCPACAWCCSGRPPHTVRGWSVLAAPGHQLPASQPKAWTIARDRPGLCVTNRADTRAIADLLADPPPGEWTAAVSISGQKHVLPYARINHGTDAWTVRFENTDITSSPAAWRHVLGAAAMLRQAGHGAEVIAAGRPDPRAIRDAADLERWRRGAERLEAYAGGPLLELALWCLTRPAIAHYSETFTEDAHATDVDHHRPARLHADALS